MDIECPTCQRQAKMITNTPGLGRTVAPDGSGHGMRRQGVRPWSTAWATFGINAGFDICGWGVQTAWLRVGGSIGVYHYGSFHCHAPTGAYYMPTSSFASQMDDALQSPPTGPPIGGLTGGRLWNARVRNGPVVIRLS